MTLNRELFTEGTINVNAAQNDHCQKINATQKRSNPRKQRKFRRNPKGFDKTFYCNQKLEPVYLSPSYIFFPCFTQSST